MTDRIAIIGLGYVGLPVAVAFAEKFPGTIGFDISAARVASLKVGEDRTNEIDTARLKRSGLELTTDIDDLRAANIFIVCVPTPIDKSRRPDLEPLRSASELVGKVLRPGGIVAFESTVYPGVTEEFCGPILAAASGLKQSVDFKLGYSPERINPGDKAHTFERILKIVSGEDTATAQALARLYGSVVTAGIHVASSIKVAEAAKVLENTQRDLNIALMNELAIICDLMRIRTREVLEAAGTKWNFLKFEPGLVGGHCIGVDPYYLTSKAQELGYNPDVILAGRRVNDSIGAYVAQRVVRLLGKSARPLCNARVGVLGLTFKENVPDIRNSKVFDIISEFETFGIKAMVHDPLADPHDLTEEYGVHIADLPQFRELDALVLAVPHRQYIEDTAGLLAMLAPEGVLADVKSVLAPDCVSRRQVYWSL